MAAETLLPGAARPLCDSMCGLLPERQPGAGGSGGWQRFDKFTLLEVRIGTGRTHQIRVHLASLGHPVAGDKLFGAPASSLGRYFLHAHRITFTSPASGERLTVEAPIPEELRQYLDPL